MDRPNFDSTSWSGCEHFSQLLVPAVIYVVLIKCGLSSVFLFAGRLGVNLKMQNLVTAGDCI